MSTAEDKMSRALIVSLAVIVAGIFLTAWGVLSLVGLL